MELWIFSVLLFIFSLYVMIQAQVTPRQFIFPLNVERTANGSSGTGHCSSIAINICHDPISSDLFDGIILTITGLGGNMWASQIFTTRSSFNITFSFAGVQRFTGLKRAEIVLFNCPEWGISVESVTLQTSTDFAGATNPTVTSCDSLVRSCIGNIRTSIAQTDITLLFTPINPNDWVYIAEVAFYGAGPTCPDDSVISTMTAKTTTGLDIEEMTAETTAAATTILPTTQFQSFDNTTTLKTNSCLSYSTSPSTQSGQVPTTIVSCSTSTVLASVISIITTAILTTVVFVLVQIALCKCPMTHRRPQSIVVAEAQNGEDETMMDEPSYVEIGQGAAAAAAAWNTIKLKQNEAYRAGSSPFNK